MLLPAFVSLLGSDQVEHILDQVQLSLLSLSDLVCTSGFRYSTGTFQIGPEDLYRMSTVSIKTVSTTSRSSENCFRFQC